jgi:CRP/FNR family cyclic AMP-dependent transcriptional regulator
MIDEAFLRDNQAIIKKLQQIPMLRAMEKEHLEALLEMSQIMEYDPGATILEEGRFDKWIFYLITGKARIVKNGKELAVIRRTGDVFGEMGVIDGSARSASVFAVDKTICLRTDLSKADALYGENKFAFRYTVFRGFAQNLANRLRMTTEELLRCRETLAQFESTQSSDRADKSNAQ